MRRKSIVVLSIVLVLVLSIALVACSKKDPVKKGSTDLRYIKTYSQFVDFLKDIEKKHTSYQLEAKAVPNSEIITNYYGNYDKVFAVTTAPNGEKTEAYYERKDASTTRIYMEDAGVWYYWDAEIPMPSDVSYILNSNNSELVSESYDKATHTLNIELKLFGNDIVPMKIEIKKDQIKMATYSEGEEMGYNIISNIGGNIKVTLPSNAKPME